MSLVKQELRYCGTEEGKLLEMRKLLIEGLVYPCLIFTESRARAADLYKEITLCEKFILVGILSGEKTESQVRFNFIFVIFLLKVVWLPLFFTFPLKDKSLGEIFPVYVPKRHSFMFYIFPSSFNIRSELFRIASNLSWWRLLTDD